MDGYSKRVLEQFFGHHRQQQARRSNYPIPVRWGTMPANVREVDPGSPPPSLFSRILDDPGRIADLWELIGRERASWRKYDPARLTGPTMMAFPELVANSPVPGTLTPIGTLANGIGSSDLSMVSTAPAPSWLQNAGQFRIVMENEIMLITAGATANGMTWTITRGSNLPAPDTCTSAAHAAGTVIYHYLTAGALINIALQSAFPAATVTVASTNAPTNQQAASTYVCDGTTDQVEINTAIASLPAGGGLVLASEGTFNLTAPIVFQQDTSAFKGFARGSTVFLVTSGFSGAAVLTCNRADVGAGRPCDRITVGEFTINGAYLGTQSTTDGIVFSGTRSTLENAEIMKMNGRGVNMSNTGTWTSGLYGTLVQYCKIHGNGNGGLVWTGSAGDSGVTQCEVFENAGGGIVVSDQTNQISNCYAWGNMDQSVTGGSRQGAGIYFLAGSGRCPVTACKIEQNRGGLVFGNSGANSGSEFNIVANTFASNSTTINPSNVSSNGGVGGSMPAGYVVNGSTNVHSDIEFQANTGGSPQWVIIALNDINTATYAGTDCTSKYAISFTSGTDAIIRLNQIPNAGATGTINYGVGGGNIFSIGQNLGYVTEASGTATITSAVTSVVVTHGLAAAPLAQDINVTLTNLPTNAIGELYVDTIGSTTFTIHCRTAPGAATAIIGWSVQTHRFS